jgi:hypothetical protein
MAAVVDIPNTNTFNDAELAFLQGVFAYRGIHGDPTEEDVKQGLEVMSAYAKQVQDNPPEDGSRLERVGFITCLTMNDCRLPPSRSFVLE